MIGTAPNGRKQMNRKVKRKGKSSIVTEKACRRTICCPSHCETPPGHHSWRRKGIRTAAAAKKNLGQKERTHPKDRLFVKSK
jgi:hypothetical protein